MTTFIKAHRHRVTFVCVTCLILVVVFVIQGPTLLGKIKQLMVPSGNVRLTFGVTDFYALFLTPEENSRVLSSLPTGAEVFATYRHRTYSFHLLSCIGGVGCIPIPGWAEKLTEKRRKFSTEITPDNSPGGPRTFSVQMPSSLDGGYVLSELYITLSADEFYRQPSYRALIEKIPVHPLDRDPPRPAFDYSVIFLGHDKTQRRRWKQDCLFVSMPIGLPEIKLPIVVQIETDPKQMALSRVMNKTCPLVSEYSAIPSDEQSDRLPPSRIAAAQTIDFAGVRNANRFSGPLPISEDMEHWFQRNNEGVYASLIEFCPFQKLRLHRHGDNAHSSRTAIWTFFKDDLVGYSGTIYYEARVKNVEKILTVRWDRYFQDGKSVGKKIVPEYCEAQGCKDAQAEIFAEISRPYDSLLAEARSYLKLRGALEPAKKKD